MAQVSSVSLILSALVHGNSARFNPESDTPVIGVPMHSPNVLVRQIVDDGLSVTKVLADRSFTNSEEALNVMTLLSRAAVAENLSRVVNELGQVQTWGTQEVLQDGVPDVKPVLKEKVRLRDLRATIRFSTIISGHPGRVRYRNRRGWQRY